jgi:hypothetical protein
MDFRLAEAEFCQDVVGFQDVVGAACVPGHARALCVTTQGHWPKYIKAQFANLERLEVYSKRMCAPLEPLGDWNRLKVMNLDFHLDFMFTDFNPDSSTWPQLPSLQNIRLHLVVQNIGHTSQRTYLRHKFFDKVVNPVLRSSSDLHVIDIYLSGIFLVRSEREVASERAAVDLIETRHAKVANLVLNFDLEGVGFPRVECESITLVADEEEADMIANTHNKDEPEQWARELASAKTKTLALESTEGCLKRTDVNAPLGVERLVVQSAYVQELVVLPGTTFVVNLSPTLRTIELVDMDFNQNQFYKEPDFRDTFSQCAHLEELCLVSTSCDSNQASCGCPLLPGADELPPSLRRLVLQGFCRRHREDSLLKLRLSCLLPQCSLPSLLNNLDYIDFEVSLLDLEDYHLGDVLFRVEPAWRKHSEAQKGWLKISKK